VQKPFEQMWDEIRTVEPNPPLLYLTLRGWIAVAGAGEFATRFFSVFWGVLCVPLIYRLARDIFRASPYRRGAGGEVTAFLIAINPYQIWHSQDVRNYTMWLSLSLLALIFFWRWQWANNHSPLRWFILAELAALYTHYFEAFILLALNIFVLAFWRRRRAKLLTWLGAQFVLAALYLPWVFVFSNRVASYGEGSGLQNVALWDIWRRTFTSFILGETLDAGVRDFLWIPFALALALIFFVMARRDKWRAAFFLLYAGIPTLAVFSLNLFRPLFLERYLNGIAPAYYLIFAYGISRLIASIASTSSQPSFVRKRAVFVPFAFFAVISWLGLTNYFYNPAYAKAPDWRGLARKTTPKRSRS